MKWAIYMMNRVLQQKKIRKNDDTDNEMEKNAFDDEEENNIPINEVNKMRNEENESTTFDNSTLIHKNDCNNSDYNIFNIFCNNKKGYLFFSFIICLII